MIIRNLIFAPLSRSSIKLSHWDLQSNCHTEKRQSFALSDRSRDRCSNGYVKEIGTWPCNWQRDMINIHHVIFITHIYYHNTFRIKHPLVVSLTDQPSWRIDVPCNRTYCVTTALTRLSCRKSALGLIRAGPWGY